MKRNLQKVLLELEEETLYGAAQIAARAFDPKQEREAYMQLKRRLNRITRDYRDAPFIARGEDVVIYRGQQCPAWTGATWQAYLAAVQPQNDKTGARDNTSSRPLYHPALVVGALDNFACYTRPQIMAFGESMGLFEDLTRRQMLNTEKYLSKLAAKLPAVADRDVEGEHHRAIQSWYGFRWKLALSRNALDDESRAKLERIVAAWRAERAAATPTEPIPDAASADDASADDASAGESVAETVVVDLARPTPWWRRPRIGFAVLAVVLVAGVIALLRPDVAARQQAELNRLAALQAPEAVDQLMALWQTPNLQLNREAVAQTIIQVAAQHGTTAHVPALRDVYRASLVDDKALAAAVAAVHRRAGTEPLQVGVSRSPLFAASVERRPVVLYPEGRLELGDWVHVDGKVTGYVAEISAAHISVMVGNGPWVFAFDAVDDEWRPLKMHDLAAWRGRLNLAEILACLNAVADVDTDGLPQQGHVSGRFHVDTYADFLAQLKTWYAGQQPVLAHAEDAEPLLVYFHYDYRAFQPKSLAASLDWFGQQLGVRIVTSGIDDATLAESWVLVHPQWDRFLSEAGWMYTCTSGYRDQPVMHVFPQADRASL